MKTKMTTGLVLFVLLIIFTLQNTTIVDVWFLFWKFSVSRALLLFIVLVVGILLGWLMTNMISGSRIIKKDEE